MHLQKPPAFQAAWLVIASLGLVLLFGGLGADVLHQISKNKTGAFDTYIHAATALRDGQNPYGKNQSAYAYIYPPFYAFVCRPLTRLSDENAARVLFVIDTGFIIASLLLIAHAMLSRLRIKTNATAVLSVALATALIAVVPIHNEMRGLETNSVLLLSFVLALFWLDRHPIAAGFALAVAINIKYLPIIAVPYLLLRRRWLAVVATVGWSIALALLPSLSLGWSTNLAYLQIALGGLVHLAGVQSSNTVAHVQGTDVATSISITSGMSRMVTSLGWARIVAPALVAAVATIWGAMILRGYPRRRLPWLRWPIAVFQHSPPFDALLAIEWAGLVTFALVFSPNTQNRNLVLAIVPVTLAAILLLFPSGLSRRRVALCIGIMLLGLILPIASMGKPFTVHFLSGGWSCWSLLITYGILHRAALSRIDTKVQPRLAIVPVDPPTPRIPLVTGSLPSVA